MNRKQELIEEFVEALKTDFAIPYPLVDMKTLVDLLGGKLVYENNRGHMDSRLIKVKDGERFKFIIKINEDVSEKRKRFSIACALGHLFLHMGYIYEPEVWERQKNGDHIWQNWSTQRKYADYEFASALLLPKRELERYIDSIEGSKINLYKMSDFFKVPVTELVNRCLSLGLIEHERM